MEELEDKIRKTGSFLESGWKVASLIGTIIVSSIGGFYLVQKMIVDHNAEIISEATIVKITNDIDPISKTEVMEFRRRDSIERLNAEAIALRYMNRSDSIGLVTLSEVNARKRLARQLDRIEARLDTDDMTKLDDQLARIWKHLQEQGRQDSLLLDLSGKMDEIKRQNQERIDNVKSGDRIK